MKFARWCSFLAIFTVSGAIVARPQAATPLGAIEELVTAEKVADVVRHYPVAVEQVVNILSESEKVEAAKQLLISKRIREAGYELRRTNDPKLWQLVHGADKQPFTFTVINSFVSGTDAVIMLRVGLPTGGGQTKFILLQFDAGEWRLTSSGLWWKESDFASDEFIQGLTPMGRNGSAAAATLNEICVALAEYRNTYQGAGYPSSLEALAGPAEPATDQSQQAEEVEDDDSPPPESPPARVPPQYGHLLDPSFLEKPLIKDGYEFHYRLIDPGVAEESGGRFQITATPVQFGKTGSRNYFVDQTAVIRFARENREANENDEPLHNEPGESPFIGLGHRIVR